MAPSRRTGTGVEHPEQLPDWTPDRPEEHPANQCLTRLQLPGQPAAGPAEREKAPIPARHREDVMPATSASDHVSVELADVLREEFRTALSISPAATRPCMETLATLTAASAWGVPGPTDSDSVSVDDLLTDLTELVRAAAAGHIVPIDPTAVAHADGVLQTLVAVRRLPEQDRLRSEDRVRIAEATQYL